jgi:hypothetical protein
LRLKFETGVVYLASDLDGVRVGIDGRADARDGAVKHLVRVGCGNRLEFLSHMNARPVRLRKCRP